MPLIKEEIKMKTIKKDYLLLLFLLLFSIGKAQEPPSSEDYNYNTFEAQKKWIVGTFLNDDKNWQLQFTKDGKWGHGGQFVFSRVKPKESTSSKPPSKEEGSISKEETKEEEKESELSPRWELKSSDYDKGYLDGGSAYEQCKNEQGKERGFLDRDRQTPMEKMSWETVEYQAKFQDCKKRFFYGIKGESESYQEGFKKGWSEAEAPLNKEKETTKKK